jgi:hypothetical protein
MLREIGETREAIGNVVDRRNAYTGPALLGALMSILLLGTLLATWVWSLMGWAFVGALAAVLVLTVVKLIAYAKYRSCVDDSFMDMKEIASTLEVRESRQAEFLRVFRPPQEVVDEELTRIAAMMRMYLTEQAVLYAQGVMPRLGAKNEPETLEEMKARFERKLFEAKGLFDRECTRFDELHRLANAMGYSVRPTWDDYAAPSKPLIEEKQ